MNTKPADSANLDVLNNLGKIRLPRVLELTGMGRTTIWRLMESGEFPEPFRLHGNMLGWDAGEVAAWLAARPRVHIKKEAA